MAITFFGKPCRRGHPGERYVSNNGCVDCARSQYLKITLTVLHRDDRKLLSDYAATLREWRTNEKNPPGRRVMISTK